MGSFNTPDHFSKAMPISLDTLKILREVRVRHWNELFDVRIFICYMYVHLPMYMTFNNFIVQTVYNSFFYIFYYNRLSQLKRVMQTATP